jgi:hypothetical protein
MLHAESVQAFEIHKRKTLSEIPPTKSIDFRNYLKIAQYISCLLSLFLNREGLQVCQRKTNTSSFFFALK